MMYEGVGRLEGGTNVANIGLENKASAEEAVVSNCEVRKPLFDSSPTSTPLFFSHVHVTTRVYQKRRLRNGHIRVLNHEKQSTEDWILLKKEEDSP
jgi:hypothetical protein